MVDSKPFNLRMNWANESSCSTGLLTSFQAFHGALRTFIIFSLMLGFLTTVSGASSWTSTSLNEHSVNHQTVADEDGQNHEQYLDIDPLLDLMWHAKNPGTVHTFTLLDWSVMNNQSSLYFYLWLMKYKIHQANFTCGKHINHELLLIKVFFYSSFSVW